MARKLRIQYPGAIYHVMNRGDHQERIFCDDEDRKGCLKSVCDYVHLNPVRAGLLRPEQPLEAYRWSSYPGYLADATPRPAWLRVDRLRAQTTVSVSWIARRLAMGTRGHLAHLLYLKGHPGAAPEPSNQAGLNI